MLFSRAQTAFDRNDIAAAERLYRAILAQRPDEPIALGYLGVIATQARRYDEAERLLVRALELEPDAADLHNNLGSLRHQRGEFERAVECYARAIALAPGYAPAHNNAGLSYQELERLDAAIAAYRTAVQLQPDFADAHWNLGLALMLNGEFEEGLREHEWRFKVARHRAWWDRRRQFPDWQGESLEGKRILVLAEQGMGDMIQFVRYAGLLAARGATVVVEAAPELIELLRTVPGVSEVVPRDGPYPRCDVQVAAMSLPLRFGTRPDAIPSTERYLRADPPRLERCRGLAGPRVRPRIGIAWAGNPEHARDRYRSLALRHFAPLLSNPAYEWIGVQKGPAASEIARLPPGCAMRDMGRHLDTFADLAALLELLDLVITVDTSVVHVAGALGRPTLLLLDAGHDWRWPRSGADARWYRSVRIVRQPARGDWAGALRSAEIEITRSVALASEPQPEPGAR